MLPYTSKPRFKILNPSGRKNEKYGRVWSSALCSFLVALQRCPRQDAPWPFQQGKSRDETTSNGCVGSQASVAELSPLMDDCPRAGNIAQRSRKERNELLESSRRNRHQPSPLWGRQDIRGRKKGEWDAHHRTLRHLVWRMQVSVVLFVFGCLKINLHHWISHVEIRHDTESFMQMAREQAQQTPVFEFSSPRRRRRVAKCAIKILFLAHSKHSCVETIWHTVMPLDLLERYFTVYTGH